MFTIHVRLNPQQAAMAVRRQIENGSITGELIDTYTAGGVIVDVYEKHYYRAGNRLTLTVVYDDAAGNTRVHAVSGGGGEGLLRFDWGASGAFENEVLQALQDSRIGGDR